MNKILVFSIIAICFFAGIYQASSAQAQSTQINYYFAGVLNDPFGTLPSGTPFHGSFSYDGSQPMKTPSSPYRGDYKYTNVSVTIDGVTVRDQGTGVINVYDHGTGYPPGGIGETTGYPTDMFHLYPYAVSGAFGGLTLAGGAGIQIVLQDVGGTVFSGPSIPGGGLSLSNFTAGNATFLQLQGGVNNYQTTFARGELRELWDLTGNTDVDGDGVDNSIDNCRSVSNADQQDTCHDDIGDACRPDTDKDGLPDACDNCPTVVNPAQTDSDKNGIGDRCDTEYLWTALQECKNPTLVQLSSLEATPSNKSVKLIWKTETEIDNAGFNVWRADGFIKITPSMIPSKGAVTEGAEYDFLDLDVFNRKQYFYLLEDVDNNGISTFHGPVKAVPRAVYGIEKESN